jgi:hypothetical protein
MGAETGYNSLQQLFLVIDRVLGMGCYMARSGVLHDLEVTMSPHGPQAYVVPIHACLSHLKAP